MYKHLLLLGILFLLYCQYNPTETNYVEVSQADSTDAVSINLNTATDSMAVWDDVRFEYELNSTTKDYKKMSVFLNDTIPLEYYESLTNKYIIQFNTNGYQNGFYKISIILVLPAGTGSLADILGNEVKIAEFAWIIHIDNSEASAIEINNIYEENGRLKIEWNRCSNANFKKYIIFAHSDLLGGHTTEIVDKNTTAWCDSNYIGGSAKYTIQLEYKDKKIQGPQKEYYSPFIKFKQVETGTHDIKITWEKPTFYSNFKKYLLIKVDSNYDIDTLAEITDVDKCQYTYSNDTFGKSYDLYIVVNSYTHYQWFEKSTSWYGREIPQYLKIEYNVPNNSYYMQSNAVIYRLDPDNLETLASISYPNHIWYFDISPDGKLLYSFYRNHFANFNPIDLAIEGSYNLDDYYKGIIAFMPTVLNNNSIYGKTYINSITQNINAGIICLNMTSPNPSKIGIDSGTDLYDFTISDNGLYVMLNNELFKIYPSGSKRYLAEFDYRHFAFFELGQKCVYTNNRQIIIYNTQTLEILSSFTFSDDIITPNVDPVSGYLGVKSVSKNLYYVIDLTTGDLIYQQKINNQYYIDYLLLNNKLFSNQGYSMDIPIQ